MVSSFIFRPKIVGMGALAVLSAISLPKQASFDNSMKKSNFNHFSEQNLARLTESFFSEYVVHKVEYRTDPGSCFPVVYHDGKAVYNYFIAKEDEIDPIETQVVVYYTKKHGPVSLRTDNHVYNFRTMGMYDNKLIAVGKENEYAEDSEHEEAHLIAAIILGDYYKITKQLEEQIK